ncbi:MAG TPA: hypothetical protein VE944_10930, partial [Nostoc sp.]|uniref:hypothetical protein n=1 Tax=Nostoc sp. TaxID=1180 RepID=UPI002D39D1E9
CFAQSVTASVFPVVTSAITFQCFAQSVTASALKIATSIRWLEVFVKAIAVCLSAKINILTQTFNRSDAYGGKLRS